MNIPCPYSQSIAAYMFLRPPVIQPRDFKDVKKRLDSKSKDITKAPVERKDLGQKIDIYA